MFFEKVCRDTFAIPTRAPGGKESKVGIRLKRKDFEELDLLGK